MLVIELIKRIKQKRSIRKLDSNDWEEIFKKSGIATVKGGIRGVTTYTISNYTATSSATASALVSAGFGIADQIHLFNDGQIDEITMFENCEILCLDMTISAVFSIIGEIAIPIPVLGAIIGNTVGMVIYNNAKSDFFMRKNMQIEEWLTSVTALQHELDEEFSSYVVDMTRIMEEFFNILSDAFSINPFDALNRSLALADYCGVPSSELLHSISEIDDYFLS